MNAQRYALISGILFVGVAILGFIPGITVAPHVHDPSLAVEAAYGRLLGLFPVNVIHNLVHLALGIWGLFAAKDLMAARTYCKGTAIIYGALTILGLIPGTNTMFGLVPIHSHDIWLHAVLAVAAAYFGFAKSGVRINVQGQGGTRAWT